MMRRTEFCEYVKQYKKQLYAIAYAILNNEVDTEDAVCSAIQKGYEHLDQLKNPGKFKPWMITITRNEALQIKRKRLNLPGDEQIEVMLEPIEDEHNELLDVVQRLQEEYRIVIVLFYYDDFILKDHKEKDIKVSNVVVKCDGKKVKLNQKKIKQSSITGEDEVKRYCVVLFDKNGAKTAKASAFNWKDEITVSFTIKIKK